MKQFLIYIILISSFSVSAQNDDLLIPYRKGNLWGYADVNGKIKIEPQYDSVSLFSTTKKIGKVYLQNKCGLINEKRKIIIPVEFDNISVIKKDLLLLEKNNKIGVFDFEGSQYIPIQYNQINYISSDYMKIKWKVVNDLETTFIETAKSEKTDSESNEFYRSTAIKSIEEIDVELPYNKVQEKPKATLDDLKKKYFNVYKMRSYNYNQLYTYNKGKYGFVNLETGNEIIPKYEKELQYLKSKGDSYNRVDLYYFIFEKDNKLGVVFEDGNEIIPAEYEEITTENPKFIFLKKNGKLGFYLNEENILILPKYLGKLKRGVEVSGTLWNEFYIIPVYIDSPKNWFYVGQNGVEFRE